VKSGAAIALVSASLFAGAWADRQASASLDTDLRVFIARVAEAAETEFRTFKGSRLEPGTITGNPREAPSWESVAKLTGWGRSYVFGTTYTAYLDSRFDTNDAAEQHYLRLATVMRATLGESWTYKTTELSRGRARYYSASRNGVSLSMQVHFPSGTEGPFIIFTAEARR